MFLKPNGSPGKLNLIVREPFIAEVQDDIHERIAELISWSMRWAAKGVWPTEGFAREAFDPKSFRYKYRGKTIANKWRQGVVSVLSLR